MIKSGKIDKRMEADSASNEFKTREQEVTEFANEILGKFKL